MTSTSHSAHTVRPFRWYLISGILFLLLVFILYTYIKQREESGNRNLHLETQIAGLKSSLAQREAELSERNKQLEDYKNYEPLIQSSRIREALYNQLPLAAGDQVLILPDSIAGIINAVAVAGNAFEYSIRYRVRKKDGSVEDIPYMNLKKVGSD